MLNILLAWKASTYFFIYFYLFFETSVTEMMFSQTETKKKSRREKKKKSKGVKIFFPNVGFLRMPGERRVRRATLSLHHFI